MFKKQLGQNFLKNKYFLKKIAEQLDISTKDTIIEIGGGHGELTTHLTQANKLIVYEIDKILANKLQKKFASYPNVEIINQNFLKADLKNFNHQYKLVGNIPYRITGLIFRKILTKDNFPKIFILTLQKEVGEKILAGNNFLGLWLKVWGQVQKIHFLKNENFQPKPKVDSLILKIKFHDQPLVNEPELFALFLKKIFKYPKKMIKNNIKLPQQFNSLYNLRPHQLSFENIIKLYKFNR